MILSVVRGLCWLWSADRLLFHLIFAGNENPRKSTKIARQVVNLPGDDLKRFVVFLHGIVHTHSRNIPVAGQGFFKR